MPRTQCPFYDLIKISSLSLFIPTLLLRFFDAGGVERPSANDPLSGDHDNAGGMRDVRHGRKNSHDLRTLRARITSQTSSFL